MLPFFFFLLLQSQRGDGAENTQAVQLHQLGIGLVVNTCEEWDGNRDEYRALGIEQVVVETIDYTPPQLAHAEQAVAAMVRFLEEKPQGKIYVHCKVRSGVVLLARHERILISLFLVSL